MIYNVLAATLASYVYGFTIEDIKGSLETFIPSAAQTPGRMNIFDFKDYKATKWKVKPEFWTAVKVPIFSV